MRNYRIVYAASCVLYLALGALGATASFDFAPLISHDCDINGNERWRILGPLIEKRNSADKEKLLAVRPFLSSVRHSPEYNTACDVLWPLFFYRMSIYTASSLPGAEQRGESWWYFAGFTHFRDRDIDDPKSSYSLWVLPFYLQGRDDHGIPYMALFPIGGTIRNFLGMDEVGFVLFPLTAYMRINEIRTKAILWPLLSSTTGPGIERFRFFPFYGVSKRRTDYDKLFIMWPFFTRAHYGEQGSAGYGYVIFPLFGRVKLEDQKSWMVLPPLFRFSSGKKLNQIYCPWPLFQKSSGIVDKLYIWPFWGRKTRGRRKTEFVLWPIYTRKSYYELDKRCSRTMILPFVLHETKRKKSGNSSEKNEKVVSRLFKFWPLLSFWREDDNVSFHFPSLCPYNDYEQIERNYAPLWTLYTHSRCGDVSEDELLWGLFQYRRSGSGMMKLSLFLLFSVSRKELNKGHEWSVLKGLVGYQRTAEGGKVRLLYFFTIGR